MNRAALAEEANKWQVLPQPERLTELYFTEPQQIPDAYGQARKQTVKFTVRNLEHQTTTYHYSILMTSAESDEVERTLGEGTLTLNPDQSRVTNRDIVVPSLLGRASVRIILSYDGRGPGNGAPKPHQQSIHYWVDTDHLGDSPE